MRRSSTKPTPGKTTPTHVTQSSALTWLLCNTYFPVYYTLVTTVELHLTLKSTYCSPIQHIILKYPENDSIYYISSYTLYKPYMLHVLSSIPCAQCTPYIYIIIYIYCTCPIYTVYIPYTYCVYIYIHMCILYISIIHIYIYSPLMQKSRYVCVHACSSLYGVSYITWPGSCLHGCL